LPGQSLAGGLEALLKILLVEDDRAIVAGLTYLLEEEGFESLVCPDFAQALEAIRTEDFDLALLDVSLPDGSGYELCKAIKTKGEIPVIMLTAMDSEVNVVMGLDIGADDYITKPFRVRELISRINSVLRRYKKLESAHSQLSLGDVVIDQNKAKVSKGGEELQLTALEYKLLLVFANYPGRVFSRNQLLEQLWDVGGDFLNDNTITVYIKRLREKIEDDPQEPKLILTVRGLGYKSG
jgi:two-component system response regulator VicR